MQVCVIHQIRNSMKYVASKNQKAFMADLKCIYKAATQNAAEQALDELEAKWGKQYPLVIKSCRSKWDNLSVYFKYPEQIRRATYTTNAVEAVHRQTNHQRDQLAEAALCGDVEGLREVGTSGAELESDTIPAEHPLRGQGRSICGSVTYADTEL